MELKVYHDTVSTMGLVCDSKAEIPLETEILIPDYLPPVFKIVKTFIHRVVLQKQVQSGHLLTEGYFRIEVLYLGEEQNLCTVEQKVAFSKQMDIKSCEDGSCHVDVEGEQQYINCRALSPRRLDVRGSYNLRVRAFTNVKQELITALSEGGIQEKSAEIPAMQILTSREKQFTLEADIDFADTPEAILHTQSVSNIHEARVVSGKAIAKGEVQVTVTYRDAQSNQLQKTNVVLPFNQVLEMEDADEECQCIVVLDAIGCTIYKDAGDEPATRFSCTCLITIQALKQQKYTGVADCFSTRYQTQVQYDDILTDILLDVVDTTVTTVAAGRLPDAELKLVECLAECQPPELLSEDGKTLVRGRAVVHLICANALGETECYDKACEYLLPKKYDAAAEEVMPYLHAACVSVTCTRKGEEADAELAVQLKGFLCRKCRTNLVESVEYGEELNREDDVALRIYYAAAGEEVFDIAKRYHASPAVIAGLAGIEGESLDANTKLLIPQAI